MPNFKYKAMNQKGERIEGVFEANSSEEVVQMISSNSYFPLMVEEIVEGTKIDLQSLRRISTKDIAIFCRQFYTMLDAGVSINSSLNILAKQHPNKKLRASLKRIEEEVKKGETLSQAMMKEDRVFPELLISMVQTGEVSGNLDTIMLRMSTHFEKENKINNKIKSAMIYPAVLSVVAISVVAFLLTFIMPMFVDMFTESGVVLPAPTKLLLAISKGIKEHGFLIVLCIVLIVFSIRYYLKSDEGELMAHKMRLKLPILKGLNEKIIVSRFTRTLATLLASGITLVQALQVVAGVLGNRVASERLLAVRESVIKGEGLSLPLSQSSIFPPMLSSMVRIGEESGALDEILNKTADFYDEELEAAIQAFTALLEPLLILVMGAVLGFMIISILLPMFSMYGTM